MVKNVFIASVYFMVYNDTFQDTNKSKKTFLTIYYPMLKMAALINLICPLSNEIYLKKIYVQTNIQNNYRIFGLKIYRSSIKFFTDFKKTKIIVQELFRFS